MTDYDFDVDFGEFRITMTTKDPKQIILVSSGDEIATWPTRSEAEEAAKQIMKADPEYTGYRVTEVLY